MKIQTEQNILKEKREVDSLFKTNLESNITKEEFYWFLLGIGCGLVIFLIYLFWRIF